MAAEWSREAIEESMADLVEDGLLLVKTPYGEEMGADCLRAILDEYGEFPSDFVVEITEAGRMAFEGGAP